MTADVFEKQRQAMVVSQLRPDGVNDPRVIAAMSAVSRENFVPEDRRLTAYADRMIPIGQDCALNPPVVTGRLLSEARILDGDRVLIIGPATGYTAAVVQLLTPQVTVAKADDQITGSFDVIMIDGAVEYVPTTLIDHLAVGGRLVTGIVEHGVTRLAIGRRGGNGFGLQSFMDAEMVILSQFAAPHTFVF